MKEIQTILKWILIILFFPYFIPFRCVFETKQSKKGIF